MSFNRFFSFGCSWTNWFWPTWSDIIAKDLNIEYENWGYEGSGNQAIQSRFIEAKNLHKFEDNDLIIVQWSGWNREDKFIDGWKLGGNIFNNPYYDKKYIKKYWNYDNDLIKNSVALISTNDAYGDNIKYQFGYNLPLDSNVEDNDYKKWLTSVYVTEHTDNIIKRYYSNIPKIEIPKFVNTRFKSNCMDMHPDVMAHLSIVENTIYPALFGINHVKSETKNFFTDYYDELSSILKQNDSWLQMQDKAKFVNQKFGLNLGKKYGI